MEGVQGWVGEGRREVELDLEEEGMRGLDRLVYILG